MAQHQTYWQMCASRLQHRQQQWHHPCINHVVIITWPDVLRPQPDWYSSLSNNRLKWWWWCHWWWWWWWWWWWAAVIVTKAVSKLFGKVLFMRSYFRTCVCSLVSLPDVLFAYWARGRYWKSHSLSRSEGHVTATTFQFGKLKGSRRIIKLSLVNAMAMFHCLPVCRFVLSRVKFVVIC